MNVLLECQKIAERADGRRRVSLSKHIQELLQCRDSFCRKRVAAGTKPELA
jgi:hypothetical protein